MKVIGSRSGRFSNKLVTKAELVDPETDVRYSAGTTAGSVMLAVAAAFAAAI